MPHEKLPNRVKCLKIHQRKPRRDAEDKPRLSFRWKTQASRQKVGNQFIHHKWMCSGKIARAILTHAHLRNGSQSWGGIPKSHHFQIILPRQTSLRCRTSQNQERLWALSEILWRTRQRHPCLHKFYRDFYTAQRQLRRMWQRWEKSGEKRK